jgi:branched-subunit amino acid aminotransferase/4-amino-4-deoxychorismate lyase
MQIFLNGQFVSSAKAQISIFDPAVQSGEGLFETILIKKSTPQLLVEHLTRLRNGAKVLGISLPKDSVIKKAVIQLIAKNKTQKGMLRITATPESFFIFTRPFPVRPDSAKVCFVQMERCLLHIKSLNYLPTVLAQRTAVKQGFDEALLVNSRGEVTEGGRTNFFWVKNGKVFTPELGSALPGITRGKVIEIVKKLGLRLTEKKVRSVELAKADEIFLTNAPMEIWPVVQIEKRKLKISSITQRIREAYLKRYD